ncbi:OLC1v1013684C1 [Oldenlandia corymbosa var. corymbosa]|uniref:OLC1v1013684C1 n=1 Tax=Oldenlandia corymbosa var. corymbosa TaxID=529605 RepID=A0AAV1DYX9_OLDCO|nr:OLC1v1013684C1 [Oldenlandia corymbosa var. corymbosa]
MGCLNFVKDGVIKLPPGFRFQPTDEEIVFQYLLRKTFSCPLPASIIPELNISKHNPWDLPGDQDQSRYFFYNKEAIYRAGNRINRVTEAGYWKTTGVEKQIVSSKRKPLVGLRKTLVFYVGKAQRGIRTDWIMHEYRIILTGKAAASCARPIKTKFLHQRPSIQLGNWALCHIFLRKGSLNNEVREIVRYHCNTCNIFGDRNIGKFGPRPEARTLDISSCEIGSISSSSDSSVVTDDDDDAACSHNV